MILDLWLNLGESPSSPLKVQMRGWQACGESECQALNAGSGAQPEYATIVFMLQYLASPHPWNASSVTVASVVSSN